MLIFFRKKGGAKRRSRLPDIAIQDQNSFDSLPFTAPKTSFSGLAIIRDSNLPEAEHIIKIQLVEGIATAFFEHGGYYWFVADRKVPIPIDKIKEESLPLFTEVIQIKHETATVLRLEPSRPIHASIIQKGFSYVLRFHDEPYQPPNSLTGHIQNDEQNKKFLLISSRHVGKTVILEDPISNNFLLVGTFSEIGIANSQKRDFVEFSILPAQQGFAIVPYADAINMVATETGYIVSRKSGLNALRRNLENDIIENSAPSTIAILSFPSLAYSALPFLEIRSQLYKNIQRLSDSKSRSDFHLSAATFFLSQKMGQEAYGYLQLYESNPDNDTKRLRYRLLKASILLLIERTDDAIAILADPAFSNYEESVLWQGIAAAQKHKWDEAKLRFDRSSDFVRRYPIYLRNWIAAIQLEVAFKQDDLVLAQTWINTLKTFEKQMTTYQRLELLYYEGLYELKKNNSAQAFAIWQNMEFIKPNSKWYVLSQLNRLDFENNTGNLVAENSIIALEHLRHLWRGDELELLLLSRLGQLYLETGNIEKGLNVLRNATAFFPENPSAQTLTKNMLEVFRSIFLGERNKFNVDAQTSLKLLRDFPELLPLGSDRIQVIDQIANNLIKEQFYGNASELLEPLITERLLSFQAKKAINCQGRSASYYQSTA